MGARPDDTSAVVLLAEVVARHTHRFSQPPEGEIPLLCMARHIRRIEACMVQPLRLHRVRLRIDARRTRETAEDGDVRILVKARIHARPQSLLESVPRLLKVVLIRAVADTRDSCDARFRGLFLSREGVPPPAIVSNHT